MEQTFIQKFIGIHSADAEQVSLIFRDHDLAVSYVDWQESPQTIVLKDVLAFKWQERDSDPLPQDDTTFQISGSSWLKEQTQGIPGMDSLVHYKVLFNACGVLDVICTEVPNHTNNVEQAASQE